MAGRRIAGVVIVGLCVIAVGVFVTPFAFPTPPPIVTGFQSTRLFSPQGDGKRDIARVAVKLNERSRVTVEIQERSTGKRARGIIDEDRPKGVVRLSWDGNDDQGRPVPDGQYVVSLRARLGKQKFNTSRRIVVDRQPPQLTAVTVQSAALSGPGEGQCRVTATAAERGSLTIEALSAAGGAPLARFGPEPVVAGQSKLWNWDGNSAGGTPAPPGPYVIRATITDTPKNANERQATCWVGHILGVPLPARPKLGDRIAVRLTDAAGAPLPGGTGVRLSLALRNAEPGGANTEILGPKVGITAQGPVGQVRLQLPRKIPPRRLWLVATTKQGQALIPLTP